MPIQNAFSRFVGNRLAIGERLRIERIEEMEDDRQRPLAAQKAGGIGARRFIVVPRDVPRRLAIVYPHGLNIEVAGRWYESGK